MTSLPLHAKESYLYHFGQIKLLCVIAFLCKQKRHIAKQCQYNPEINEKKHNSIKIDSTLPSLALLIKKHQQIMKHEHII